MSDSDRVFNIINNICLGIVFILVVYPIYFIVIASFSDPNYVSQGNVWLVPMGANLEGYKSIFKDPVILTGYKNSIVYTSVGTFINITVTILAGYALSRKDLVGRNAFMFLFTFTMFFSGGLIPTYLVVRKLGLINKIWALVLPNALSVYYLIIARTFFISNIPEELREAAVIDGCTNTRFFVSVVLPLSKAIVSVLSLFYAVVHWNSFFNAMIYIRDEDKYPLQFILRGILLENEMRESMTQTIGDASDIQNKADMIKYGVIIVASLPVLIAYPFAQRYFIKGMMIGSIKG
ncbi:MAG: carbohydrate ABC transporter permease [Clostridiaceae bacterium]|nr:carbohydrate ABC transporter permease [Clostridiaceae bacterium]